MRGSILSIKWRNAYGNIGSGVCLLVLGLSLFAGTMGYMGLASAVSLLACSGTALYACLSKNREMLDEMAIADEREAASFAIKAALILLGLAACAGLTFGTRVSLDALACVAIGGALVAYGVSFAWLERC
ncbi:MAG: hypothetical protein Q4B54_07330 [Coriobacteriales bacterium]|nr:hypothetical protein [Coriobacteriales bacterium]